MYKSKYYFGNGILIIGCPTNTRFDCKRKCLKDANSYFGDDNMISNPVQNILCNFHSPCNIRRGLYDHIICPIVVLYTY